MILCLHCGKNPVKNRGQKYCSPECGWADKQKYKDGDTKIWNIRFGNGKESKPFPYRVVYVGAKKQFIMEHRLVMEKRMGRPLKPTDRVLHLNKDTLDNRPENLRAFESREKLAMARLGHHFSEENMFNEDCMKALDRIFGFSKIIMQPARSPQCQKVKYGQKTIYRLPRPGSRTRTNTARMMHCWQKWPKNQKATW